MKKIKIFLLKLLIGRNNYYLLILILNMSGLQYQTEKMKSDNIEVQEMNAMFVRDIVRLLKVLGGSINGKR